MHLEFVLISLSPSKNSKLLRKMFIINTNRGALLGVG